jgi:membrane protease subunit (stomatin/prohibitin family)
VDDLDGQLRGLMLQHISDAVAQRHPLPGPGGQPGEFAKQLQGSQRRRVRQARPGAGSVTVQNVSLPEELQKILDQKIGMGMVGDMGKFMQYQTAQAIPEFAEGRRRWRRHGRRRHGPGRRRGAGPGDGAAAAARGCRAGPPSRSAAAAAAAAAAVGLKPDEVMATLEKLAD